MGDMNGKHGVAVFVEGEFERIFRFANPWEANGFASGAETGAGFYGAGCFIAVEFPPTTEIDRDELVDAVGEDQVQRAWKEWEAKRSADAEHKSVEPKP